MHTLSKREGEGKKDRRLVGDMERERKKDNMKGNERGIGGKRSRRGGGEMGAGERERELK